LEVDRFREKNLFEDDMSGMLLMRMSRGQKENPDAVDEPRFA